MEQRPPSASAVSGHGTDSDGLPASGHVLAALVEEMHHAADVPQLAAIRERAEHLVVALIRQGTPPGSVAAEITAINDALVARLIALARTTIRLAGGADPRLDFCWLTCGSDGRKEQFLRTDQDTALIYDDPPPDRAEDAARYFQDVAIEVTRGLAACGFALCAGRNMASNPRWCQPRTVWESHVHHWIRVPDEEALLNAAVFFDLRPVHGNASLAEHLRDHITWEFGRDRTGLILLAKNALRAPAPTGFRKRLLLERHGAGKGRFDIKLRAIKPFTDAVRVLALDRGLHETGTLERLAALATTDASLRELRPELIAAHEAFVRCRVVSGAWNDGRGRYIDPVAIDSVTMHRLMDAFDAVKALLTVVRVRYQLDALGLF